MDAVLIAERPGRKTYGYSKSNDVPRGTSAKGCGRESLSNGVHPKQIPQAKKLDAAVGAPYTDYNPETGDAIFRDADHERNFFQAHQRVNRNAGYRDPCPGDFAGRRDEYLHKLDKARAAGMLPTSRPILPFPENW